MRTTAFATVVLGMSITLVSCAYEDYQEIPSQEVLPEKRAEKLDVPEVRGGALAERLLSTGILELGNRDAPVTLLLFTEHHCRYCRDFLRDHFPKLQEAFIDPGHMRFQVAILPLKKYEYSEDAARAMHCSARQNAGIAMHETLLQPVSKRRDAMIAYARTLEIDTDIFADCLDGEGAQEAVQKQQALARSLNVTLVPTLFLNGEKHIGLPYYPDLRGMIEAELTLE